MSLFNTVQADEAASIRSPEWAQPVGNQYNLHQMTPTLYRSALPDERALPLLQKLRIATVINFLPESDAQWLQSSDIKQVQLSYRTNHVDDSEVLAAIRAIQAVAYSFGEWGLQHQRLCVVLNERLDHHYGPGREKTVGASLLAKNSTTPLFIQETRVIVDVLREQARSYSERGVSLFSVSGWGRTALPAL